LLASELLNSVRSVQKLYLKDRGISFAAHKALNNFYEEIGEHADKLIETYQGAHLKKY
jgi:hypothetical protein